MEILRSFWIAFIDHYILFLDDKLPFRVKAGVPLILDGLKLRGKRVSLGLVRGGWERKLWQTGLSGPYLGSHHISGIKVYAYVFSRLRVDI